jgi:hypothetical protein
VKALEHLHRRGLAGAIGPEEPEDLTPPDVEGHAVDGPDVAARAAAGLVAIVVVAGE